MHGKFGLLSPGKASSHSTALPIFVVISCVQCFRVSVIHRTGTWTTGYLTCVRSYVCAYTRGWGTPTSESAQHFAWKNCHKFFLCSGQDSNLWSWNPLDLEADAWATTSPCTVVLYGCVFSYAADPFAQVCFLTQSMVTEQVPKTLCPTWDQTLIFGEIEIYGRPKNLERDPPDVYIELFDHDTFVSFTWWGVVWSCLFGILFWSMREREINLEEKQSLFSCLCLSPVRFNVKQVSSAFCYCCFWGCVFNSWLGQWIFSPLICGTDFRACHLGFFLQVFRFAPPSLR